MKTETIFSRDKSVLFPGLFCFKLFCNSPRPTTRGQSSYIDIISMLTIFTQKQLTGVAEKSKKKKPKTLLIKTLFAFQASRSGEKLPQKHFS